MRYSDDVGGGMVMCWGFDALVWSCLMCDLWVVCCVSCIALVR